MSNVTIPLGGTAFFAGTGTPDPQTSEFSQLEFRWNFGGGAPNRTVEDPGSVTFNTPGKFTVTFTVIELVDFEDGLEEVGRASDRVVVTVAAPPDGTIDSPVGNVAINAGESVNFSGTGTAPNGSLPLSFLWDFGGGAPNSTAEDPGAVTFNTPGTFVVTYTVTDSAGVSDPSPATVTVTVSPDQAPNGTIQSPTSNVTINVGESVDFAGTGTDPDGDLPLSFLWDFGGGAPNSTAQDPGAVNFNMAGSFNVTFTVTDSTGLSDPSPGMVTVQVSDLEPLVITPSNDVVLVPGQSATFTGGATGGTPPYRFSWTFEGGEPGSSTLQDPGEVTYAAPGTFAATLEVIDSSNVSSTVTRTVRVDDIAELLDGFATTDNQKSVANVIGIVCPQGIASTDLQRDCNALVDTAAAESGGSTAASGTSNALAQLTPDQADIPATASQNSVAVQAKNIGNRLTALRAGATGINIGGLGFDFDGQLITAKHLESLFAANHAETGGAASADDAENLNLGRLGIFLNGTFSFGKKDATDNVSGFDLNTQGVTLGADYRFTNEFVAGAAFGYLHTNNDLDANGGELGINGYSFTLYGTYYPSERFYIEGDVTYGFNNFDQNRNVRYTLTGPETVNANQTLSADFDGDQWGLSIGSGYEFNQDAWTFGPVGRLQYINADIDSYREQASNADADGSGWTVNINDQEYKSLTLNLGGQASYAISQSWGVLVPQGRFEWVHEFEHDSRFVTGNFVGDPSRETFSLATDPVDKNYFQLGIGVSGVFSRGRSAFIQYQRVLDFENLDYNTVNAGMRWEF